MVSERLLVHSTISIPKFRHFTCSNLDSRLNGVKLRYLEKRGMHGRVRVIEEKPREEKGRGRNIGSGRKRWESIGYRFVGWITEGK